MNNLQIKGEWNTLRGKIKEKYGNITDDDLRRIDGKREQLVGLLQKKLGKTKEEVEKEVEAL
ncbi:CsbD family protein [Flammeovirgaceae bacterium SG7u.111]|nr:CsbD family protein [Flammeovirgaceae bacterium SG7u.132]WPO34358.1 CsbD family protein [Flammeovirgaceae bacterium SG7u.111]